MSERDKTQVFQIELTMDERHWLSEEVESAKQRLTEKYGHGPGDDREYWCKVMPIIERVEEELDGAFKNPVASDADIIDCYEREFYPFSNFSAFQIRWREHEFPTSEHAYQAEKFNGCGALDIWREIQKARSAHEAFKIAQIHADLKRHDWDEIKLGVMEQILRTKLSQHPYVQKKLRDSGDRQIIECSWRDDFWGWGPNRDGQNMLGKLWMKIRDDVFKSQGGGT